MAERVRGFDWKATPLGPIGAWPHTLHVVVDLMLNSRQPAYVAWGADLTMLYNDGFIPILGGKHPDGLGRPFSQTWADIWDDIRPMVEATMAGEAQHFIDQTHRPGRTA